MIGRPVGTKIRCASRVVAKSIVDAVGGAHAVDGTLIYLQQLLTTEGVLVFEFHSVGTPFVPLTELTCVRCDSVKEESPV